MQSLVDNGHHLASYDTSLVVSGGVDCWKRRRNVYDKKLQRYTKDNRTAHLTACSDKSLAYVTNNKRIYWMFCTIEANYWQTRSIARPLCDSRATCSTLLRLIDTWNSLPESVLQCTAVDTDLFYITLHIQEKDWLLLKGTGVFLSFLNSGWPKFSWVQL